eukprot:365917-Chlamydomonas_euryale.AAC.16
MCGGMPRTGLPLSAYSPSAFALGAARRDPAPRHPEKVISQHPGRGVNIGNSSAAAPTHASRVVVHGQKMHAALHDSVAARGTADSSRSSSACKSAVVGSSRGVLVLVGHVHHLPPCPCTCRHGVQTNMGRRFLHPPGADELLTAVR